MCNFLKPHFFKVFANFQQKAKYADAIRTISQIILWVTVVKIGSTEKKHKKNEKFPSMSVWNMS